MFWLAGLFDLGFVWVAPALVDGMMGQTIVPLLTSFSLRNSRVRPNAAGLVVRVTSLQTLVCKNNCQGILSIYLQQQRPMLWIFPPCDGSGCDTSVDTRLIILLVY